MYIIKPFLFIAVLANNGISCSHDPPCLDSRTRFEKILSTTLNNVIKGTGSTNDCFDPLPLPLIIGNFSNINYSCYNSTLTGLKKCHIKKFKVSPDIRSAELVLDCPRFNLTGDADLEGYILYLPARSFGGYSVSYGRHIMTIYVQLKHVGGCSSNYHIQFGEFSLRPEAKGKTRYKFDNIFDGNKNVTCQRTAFANEHSDEVVYFSQGPVLNPVVKNLLEISNKQLAKITRGKD